MADSNITKRALAEALKELLKAEPFAQVSVGEICEKCHMNRKSFYYHFKDKYDLVNWIYSTEFIAVAKERGYSDVNMDLLADMCVYFYDNRDFYRRVFIVEGQNSFTDYFKDINTLILSQDVEKLFGDDGGALDFYVVFYTDAFVCAIRRWILQKDCIPAEEFVRRLKRCLIGLSQRVMEKIQSREPTA